MYFRRSQNGFLSPKGYISFGAIYVLAFHVLCLEGCVKKLKDDNGCLIDKQVVIQEGEDYTTPACLKLCSCRNGQLSCNNDYKCGANAECLQENSTYQCTCKEGFLRIGDTCVSICSTNEKYGNCSCETSCSNPQPCVPCAQGQHCYCPSGFFLQEQDCVRQEDCGCFMDGMIVPEGQTYIASGCSRKCSCINGSLTCDDNFECGSNATCMQQNNTHECRCNVGYSLVGETCVSICSNSEVFGNCTCEKSCNNPEVCEICDQSQRCYCRSGFFLQDQDCVRQEDCGCFIDGILLSVCFLLIS
ncbi:Zonadhesin [Holothuria leucospilota]|uniref:Zonadhesin n=1 Tax=Holothuria leucospilota TaxID=206669 RepID=A0A9Q1BW93_HOLLE|nr:Zonadhesin [Holothuria leucospilota]